MKKKILVIFNLILLISLYSQDNRGMKNASNINDDNESVLGRKGKDYALVIATDQYDYWTALNNPVNDGRAIAKELKEIYGFNVETLENPTLEKIALKLQEYNGKKYGDEDQLFVFIAGHGYFHDVTKQGYLVAKNSKLPDDDPAKTTLLLHSYIREVVDNIQCKHILLMMDVCFGGTIDRSIAMRGNESSTNATPLEFIEQKMQYKTRLYITSADKQYVADGEAGHNSPFADKVLRALRTYGGEEGFVDVHKMMTHMYGIKPQPILGKLSSGDEPGSDFFFIRNLKQQLSTLTVNTNVSSAQIYIDDKLTGSGFFKSELAFGKKNIQITASGYKNWRKEIELGDKSVTINAVLEKAVGKLKIRISPNDANIFIDNNPIGKGQFEGDVAIGSRSIRVFKPGYVEVEQYAIVGNEPASVFITLQKIKADLTLSSIPVGANVQIDGQNRGITPLLIAGLEFGKHTIRFNKTNYNGEEIEVNVNSESPLMRGIELRETIDFQARKEFNNQVSSKRTFAWTTLVIAGAASVTGIVYQTKANTAYNSYRSSTIPTDISNNWDEYNKISNTRNIVFGVGGAFVAWSIYHWLTKPDYNEILNDFKKESTTALIYPTTNGFQVILKINL